MSKLLTRNCFTVKVIGARTPSGSRLIATGKKGPLFTPNATGSGEANSELADVPQACGNCGGFNQVRVRDGQFLRKITCPDASHGTDSRMAGERAA